MSLAFHFQPWPKFNVRVDSQECEVKAYPKRLRGRLTFVVIMGNLFSSFQPSLASLIRKVLRAFRIPLCYWETAGLDFNSRKLGLPA